MLESMYPIMFLWPVKLLCNEKLKIDSVDSKVFIEKEEENNSYSNLDFPFGYI